MAQPQPQPQVAAITPQPKEEEIDWANMLKDCPRGSCDGNLNKFSTRDGKRVYYKCLNCDLYCGMVEQYDESHSNQTSEIWEDEYKKQQEQRRQYLENKNDNKIEYNSNTNIAGIELSRIRALQHRKALLLKQVHNIAIALELLRNEIELI